MKKLIFIIPFLTFFISFGCTQDVTVFIKERNAIQLLPIEYKLTSGDTASAIRVNANNDLVEYSYLDQNDNVISSSSVAMDTDRPFSEIKTDLFISLSLTDLATMTFTTTVTSSPNYVAFGNLINRGWPDFAWSGRSGTTHLANGEISTVPYNSFTRTFGTRVLVDAADTNDIRGGSHCIIDNKIYFFTGVMHPITFEFYSISLYKSTDLTGTSWTVDTLLWSPGTHGGINETTYGEYNPYGTPINITGETWIVPWYEFNESRTIWLIKYFYTEDNFDTWEVRSIPTDIYSVNESSILNIGQDTLITVSRNETSTPMMATKSIDGGDNWDTWKLTNLGSFEGVVMGSVINTPEYGIVCVYADRGTGNIMISKNNTIENITTYPYVWNTPEVIYHSTGDSYDPLGYPSIVRVAPYRYMIAFSIETSGSTARLYIGDGRLDNIGVASP